MSKKEIRFQLSSYFFILRKLLAIICSKGMHAIRNRLQQVNHGIAHLVGGLLLDFTKQSKTRFAFDQGHNRLMVPFAHDRVYFPITNPSTLLNNCRAVLNTHSVRQLPTAIISTITLAAFLLAALLKPPIIICDEPTTALDVVVQRGVVQLLKDIQENLKNSIILVTHDMGVQANIADRIGIMYAGKIVEEAPTQDIFSNPSHPYTKYLINSLPRFGDKSVRESAPGNPPSLSDIPNGCPFHPRCPYVQEICRQQMPRTIMLNINHKVAC